MMVSTAKAMTRTASIQEIRRKWRRKALWTVLSSSANWNPMLIRHPLRERNKHSEKIVTECFRIINDSLSDTNQSFDAARIGVRYSREAHNKITKGAVWANPVGQ